MTMQLYPARTQRACTCKHPLTLARKWRRRHDNEMHAMVRQVPRGGAAGGAPAAARCDSLGRLHAAAARGSDASQHALPGARTWY